MANTLADTFLNDLDELGDDSDEEPTAGGVEAAEQGGGDEAAKKKAKAAAEMEASLKDLEDLDSDSDDDDDDDEVKGLDEGGADDLDAVLGQIAGQQGLDSVVRLRKSRRFQGHMQRLERLQQQQDSSSSGMAQSQDGGRLEDNEEYQLIVESNQLILDIDEEVINVHRFVCDLYSKKFPELESLLTNRLDYIRVVERIGNEMDMTLVELGDLLAPASVMLVSVTGSTTSGQPLSPQDLDQCLQGAREVQDLEQAKTSILEFVESRMTAIAPNICALIGSRLAAQLLGLSGGLTQLSKIPSCNLQVMGQEKRALAGYGAAASLPHCGLIYHCELVQDAPPYLRSKALKVTAAKLVLAARVDSFQQDMEGALGKKLRTELEDKIEKWQEPQKAKTKKALPAPDSKPKKKRGGKRVRRYKEKFEQTEVRKGLNRRSFAKLDTESYADDAMGLEFGLLGKSGGTLRAPKKKEQKQVVRKRKVSTLSSGATNGLASSLVFTPIQGIELVNPNAQAEKVAAANKKWFNANSGFMSAKPT